MENAYQAIVFFVVVLQAATGRKKMGTLPFCKSCIQFLRMHGPCPFAGLGCTGISADARPLDHRFSLIVQFLVGFDAMGAPGIRRES